MGLPGLPSSQVPPGLDWIVRRFEDIERTIRELGPSIAQSFAGTVADLQTQQATLASQQATLTNQQTQLSNQLASINTLVNEQVTGWTGEATQDVASYPYNGSTGTYAAVSVPVPSGYSTAYVTAVSTVRAQAVVGNTIGASAVCVIGGNSGRQAIDGGTLGACVTVGHSYTVTGLSGGSISVSTTAGVTNATVTTSGWVTTSVTTVFVR